MSINGFACIFAFFLRGVKIIEKNIFHFLFGVFVCSWDEMTMIHGLLNPYHHDDLILVSWRFVNEVLLWLSKVLALLCKKRIDCNQCVLAGQNTFLWTEICCHDNLF